MNKIEKGRRTEKEILEYYKKQGYNLFWRATRSRFQNLDFFGLFDIVVRNKEETIYIQVKTNYTSSINALCSEKGNQGISIYEFVCNFLKEDEKVLIWNKKQKQGVYVVYSVKPLVGAEKIAEKKISEVLSHE
ncbi:MAG: hypothetical protein QXF48_01590 [Candidatus Anstonellaceae archaeon]